MIYPRTIILPGLVDLHVHLRDPGQTHKEDFYSGTGAAALGGGYTMVFDMPNNAVPITTVERLKEKIALAKKWIVCDIGFYFGSMGDNLDEFAEASRYACGLKLYLNHTQGNYLLDTAHLKKIYQAWPADQPILLHAEEDVIDVVIDSLQGLSRPIHVCHMPSSKILKRIISAKKAGLPVTCGVTPHHLFLTDQDGKRLGHFGSMKPSLKSQKDVDYLWEHLDDIDIVESDHAPHTKAEKRSGAFGVPGLETTLPLLLTAEAEGKMSREQIIDKCYTRPLEIIGAKAQSDTEVIVTMKDYEVKNEDLKTRCGWTPFAGHKLVGRVQQVTLRGKIVYKDGKVLAKAGSGRVIN